MAVVEELADEGDEITVEDAHRWTALDPKVGMVLEVHLGHTSLPVEAEVWAAFLILATSNETDGSHTLTCRLLGCEDAEIQAALRGNQCAGDVALHLCLSRPCTPTREMEATTIHVTRVRLWRWTTFKDTGYLPPDAGEVVKDLLKADRGRRPKAAAKDKPAKADRTKGRSPKPAKPKSAPESGLTPAMKAALREKLSTVRTKLKPGAKSFWRRWSQWKMSRRYQKAPKLPQSVWGREQNCQFRRLQLPPELLGTAQSTKWITRMQAESLRRA